MAIFVVDASAALACASKMKRMLGQMHSGALRQGDRIVVPARWPAEILNGLLVASRRKRIKPDEPAHVRTTDRNSLPIADYSSGERLQPSLKRGISVGRGHLATT